MDQVRSLVAASYMEFAAAVAPYREILAVDISKKFPGDPAAKKLTEDRVMLVKVITQIEDAMRRVGEKYGAELQDLVGTADAARFKVIKDNLTAVLKSMQARHWDQR